MEEKTIYIEGVGTESIKIDENTRITQRELRSYNNALIDSDRYKYYIGKNKPMSVEKSTHGSESVHEIEFAYDKNDKLVTYYQSGKLFTGYTYYNYLFDGMYDEYLNYDDIFPEEHLYKYDDRCRLISEVINEGIIQYIYDSSGNIIAKTNGEKTYVFQYLNNKLKSVSIVCGTNTENVSCAYDANGLPKVYRNCYLNWDDNSRLTEYDGVFFCYEEAGNRKSKNDICFEYKDGKLIRETRENIIIEYFYGLSGIVAFKLNGELYYYIKNPYGDISRITDKNNNIVSEYRYDAFGNHKVCTPNLTENLNPTFIGNINPIRYRSLFYDTETKLYLINNRYYDPETCRYISPDTNGSSIFKPSLNICTKI